jgi:ABC-2 type transport system permease protein
MFSVYKLTLRQLSGFRRMILMALMGALPVMLALAMSLQKESAAMVRFENTVLGEMLSGAIGPLIVLAIAGSAFAIEIEDRTIANIFLAPIPRWKIAVPKLLATFTLAAPFMLLSGIIASYVGFLGDSRAILAVASGVLVGVALYSSVFMWLGLWTTHAIGIGLLYVVLWEGFLTTWVKGIQMLSIRHYAISFMHGVDARRFAESDNLGMTAVSVISAVVLFGFLYLTIRQLRRMDVP